MALLAKIVSHKNAKKLPKGETQSDFDQLKGLYFETMSESKNPSIFNEKANYRQ